MNDYDDRQHLHGGNREHVDVCRCVDDCASAHDVSGVTSKISNMNIDTRGAYNVHNAREHAGQASMNTHTWRSHGAHTPHGTHSAHTPHGAHSAYTPHSTRIREHVGHTSMSTDIWRPRNTHSAGTVSESACIAGFCDELDFDGHGKEQGKKCVGCSQPIVGVPYFTPVDYHSRAPHHGPGSGRGYAFNEHKIMQDATKPHQYWHTECVGENTHKVKPKCTWPLYEKDDDDTYINQEVCTRFGIEDHEMATYPRASMNSIMEMSKMSAFDEHVVNITPKGVIYKKGGYFLKVMHNGIYCKCKAGTLCGHIDEAANARPKCKIDIQLLSGLYGQSIEPAADIKKRLPESDNYKTYDYDRLQILKNARIGGFKAIYTHKKVAELGEDNHPTGRMITLEAHENSTLKNDGKPNCSWRSTFNIRPIENSKRFKHKPNQSNCGDIDIESNTFGVFLDGNLAGLVEMSITSDTIAYGIYSRHPHGDDKGDGARCIYVNNVFTLQQYAANGLSKHMLWFAQQLALRLNQHEKFTRDLGPIKHVFLVTQPKNDGIRKVATDNNYKERQCDITHHSALFIWDVPASSPTDAHVHKVITSTVTKFGAITKDVYDGIESESVHMEEDGSRNVRILKQPRGRGANNAEDDKPAKKANTTKKTQVTRATRRGSS